VIRRFAAIVCLVIMAAGCSDSTVTVDVFAASSLTDVFTELERRFEAENPGVDIRLNLAGSDTLRRQIDDGANAHVFAPASIELFDGLDAEPTPYATNQIMVVLSFSTRIMSAVVDPGTFEGLLVARCAPGVPCGDATDRLIDELGIDLAGAIVTSETDVRSVLSKVELGEVDVGFVYFTDVAASLDNAASSGSLPIISSGITAPSSSVTLAVAALQPADGSAVSEAAHDFSEFIVSPVNESLFRELGFAPAP
jgi:molybdate transport system substrate-binding protein